MNKNEFITVCSDFDFTCMQHKKLEFFIIVDRKTQCYTKTDNCIMKVKNNISNYKWEKFDN